MNVFSYLAVQDERGPRTRNKTSSPPSTFSWKIKSRSPNTRLNLFEGRGTLLNIDQTKHPIMPTKSSYEIRSSNFFLPPLLNPTVVPRIVPPGN